jgi:anti-anti-sigma regulatory factor
MVGGDLYDVVRLDRQRLILLVADAAGHGLSAAMLSVLFRNRLPMLDPDTHEPNLPSHALRSANNSLLQGFATPGLFLTAAYCLIDMTDGHLTAASAGHPPLIVQRKSGDFERLFHTGPALGLYPEAQFTDEEIVLEPGDRLLLYTDGLYDRLPPGDAPPSDRVVSALRDNTRDGVSDEDSLLTRLAAVSDAPKEADSEVYTDDITLLSLSVTPAPSALDNGSHAPPPAPPAAAIQEGVEILAGGDTERTTLSIRGAAGWAQSAAFHQACTEAIETTRALSLDLTLCNNLDSTFLGTIHELADRADRAHVELRLQGVTPPVEALFTELGMKRILERMLPAMLPLPTHMSPLTTEGEDARTRGVRILKAHESLAAINERNRREFDPLLLSLRQEVGAA